LINDAMKKTRMTLVAVRLRSLAITIILALLAGSRDGLAQTGAGNSGGPGVMGSRTGMPAGPVTPATGTNSGSAIDARLAVIREIMPQYFNSRRDEVEDRLSISTMDKNVEDADAMSLDCKIIAFVQGHQPLPQSIYLHLTGQSAKARFDYSHDITIRYDDLTVSLEDPFYDKSVLSGGDTLEQINMKFTLEQFHDLAFAKSVYFKLALKNYEITPDQRQSWKLLWTYFDLNRAQLDAQTGQFGPLPPLTKEETDLQAAAKSKADQRTAVLNRVLRSNQDAAAQGDAYGLLRMGERYRDGEGVDKDLAKARNYLQKAADAGSLTASNELSALPGP
jgi:hypothetical protein